jgi:nicotinamidase-related amidase
MTVTALDPKTALIVVDLQKGVVSLPGGVNPMEDVVRHACILAAAFRKHGLPVVLVNVAGGAPGRTEQPRTLQDLPAGWTDLISELDRQRQDHVVTKHTPGAFTRTGLEAHLRLLGAPRS